MKLQAEISVGELIDKITILEIKLDQIGDRAKRAHVAHEYAALNAALPYRVGADDAVRLLRGELKAVNAELWRIEDNIRSHERTRNFGAEFVDLARAVYRVNDRRAAFKRQINEHTQSDIVEEKSYEAY